MGTDWPNHVPFPALWALRWKEVLIVKNGKPRWLDDSIPHIRQWAQIVAGDDYRPDAILTAAAAAS